MRNFFVILFLIFSLSFLATTYFFFNLPPEEDGEIIIANLVYFLFLFFISLAIASTLMLYFASFSFAKRKSSIAQVNLPKILLLRALRRGVVFSLAVSLLLALRALGLGNLLNLILLIGIFILTEAYLSNR